MQNIIKINNLQIDAIHGVLEEEKKNPQPFIFNVEIHLNYLKAAKTDDLNNTLSYCDVMQFINDFTKGNSFNLIETLAYRCALSLMLKFSQIEQIDLEVEKPLAPYPLKFKSVATKVSLSWHTAYLSLGSNLGNREAHLKDAIKKLNDEDEIIVTKESSLYSNPPYGGVATEEFINQAIEIKTLLNPLDLLDKINAIEAELGRVRDVHWGNRTIDIDIVFYDNITMNTERLTIPHKDYKNRDFVLVPLSQIAPHLI